MSIADEIITKVTEADSKEAAYASMNAVPKRILAIVADQLHIDPVGHESGWLKRHIVDEARAGIQDRLIIPGIDPENKSDYIAVHAVTCNECRRHSEIGTEDNAYGWMGTHFEETKHTNYFGYKIERSRGRMFPGF